MSVAPHVDLDGDGAHGHERNLELGRWRRAVVSGILGMGIGPRRSGLTGCDAWLDPLCHLLTSPAAAISLLGNDGTVTAATSTTRHHDLDRTIVGTRAQSSAEWGPLLDGTRAWTEVDHTRSARAFRAMLDDTGSTSIIHLAAPTSDGRPAAILSVVAPLVGGRPPDLLRHATRAAQLLGWALADAPVAPVPGVAPVPRVAGAAGVAPTALARVADLRQDPRDVVAALADALETLAPPVVHLAGLGRPAVANAPAAGLLDGSTTTPRTILEHPLVGHELVADALFGHGGPVERRSPRGVTKLQLLRDDGAGPPDAPNTQRPLPIEGIVIVLPRQMSAAPGPAIELQHAVSIPEAWDLSRRERDVVALLLQGDRVASIATKLYVSTETVRGHLKRVYRKVGVRSQIELIVQARSLSSPSV